MLSLTIYLCMTKSAGFLGALLSWSAFRPLSRMSYAIYLTHAWIVYIVLGTRRQLIDQSSRSLAFHLLATLLSSLLIGFAFNVLVETPIINALGEYKRNRIRSSTLRKENIREIEEEDTEKKSKDYQLLVIKTKS